MSANEQQSAIIREASESLGLAAGSEPLVGAFVDIVNYAKEKEKGAPLGDAEKLSFNPEDGFTPELRAEMDGVLKTFQTSETFSNLQMAVNPVADAASGGFAAMMNVIPGVDGYKSTGEMALESLREADLPDSLSILETNPDLLVELVEDASDILDALQADVVPVAAPAIEAVSTPEPTELSPEGDAPATEADVVSTDPVTGETLRVDHETVDVGPAGETSGAEPAVVSEPATDTQASSDQGRSSGAQAGAVEKAEPKVELTSEQIAANGFETFLMTFRESANPALAQSVGFLTNLLGPLSAVAAPIPIPEVGRVDDGVFTSHAAAQRSMEVMHTMMKTGQENPHIISQQSLESLAKNWPQFYQTKVTSKLGSLSQAERDLFMKAAKGEEFTSEEQAASAAMSDKKKALYESVKGYMQMNDKVPVVLGYAKVLLDSGAFTHNNEKIDIPNPAFEGPLGGIMKTVLGMFSSFLPMINSMINAIPGLQGVDLGSMIPGLGGQKGGGSKTQPPRKRPSPPEVEKPEEAAPGEKPPQSEVATEVQTPSSPANASSAFGAAVQGPQEKSGLSRKFDGLATNQPPAVQPVAETVVEGPAPAVADPVKP